MQRKARNWKGPLCAPCSQACPSPHGAYGLTADSFDDKEQDVVNTGKGGVSRGRQGGTKTGCELTEQHGLNNAEAQVEKALQ